MSHTPTLLASTQHQSANGMSCYVATFTLDASMGHLLKDELYKGIDSWSRMPAEMIVLDITKGEPSWLVQVLDRFGGFGAPLTVHPIAAASKPVLDSLRQAQAQNASHLAKLLGY